MLHDGRLLGRKASTFTLQWHLTNACELSCLHCYDRSSRATPTLAEAERVLDDLLAFCREKRVTGQVCLTGGNPLLHPSFVPIYAATVKRGFPVSILGNPASETQLRQIAGIFRPVYYQVSLEGLPETNDRIRGPGHFDRVVAFLDLLRTMGIPSHVMLTVHRENLEEVLPLAKRLRGAADRFSFTRLSQVGEGEELPLPSRDEYTGFLSEYLRAARTDRSLRFKENLFNALPRRRHRKPFRGCTGFGCGAAFNFVALLPDGEVHACRKFPSPIGHLRHQTLREVWESPVAKEYRRGSKACRTCRLRNVCGGCLAVSYGAGLSPLRDRDPHCSV
jgi:selenobiotic family peptide radical SAM maturase